MRRGIQRMRYAEDIKPKIVFSMKSVSKPQSDCQSVLIMASVGSETSLIYGKIIIKFMVQTH